MPLVGRQSYLGNAGLRTMRAAGEEVGFNLTGRVYSSPLTFGLSEMRSQALGGGGGCGLFPRCMPHIPLPAVLYSLPRGGPGAGISHAEKNQADAKP